MIIEIPFDSTAMQQFSIQLGTDNFTFFKYWNDRSSVWMTDITDASTNTTLIEGVPLLLGSRLLSSYCFGIGEMLATESSGSGLDAGDPTTGDMGTRVTVNWFSPDVVPA